MLMSLSGRGFNKRLFPELLDGNGWVRRGEGEGHGWAAEPPSPAIHQLSERCRGSEPGFPGDSPALEWTGTQSWAG